MTFTIPIWFLWVLIVWMALNLIETVSRLVLWWLKRRLAVGEADAEIRRLQDALVRKNDALFAALHGQEVAENAHDQ